MLGFDPVALIESGYETRGSDAEWLERVAGAIKGPFDTWNHGLIAYFMTPAGPRDPCTVISPGSPLTPADMVAGISTAFGEKLDEERKQRFALAMQRPGFSTLLESLGWILEVRKPIHLVDSPGLVINSADGKRAVIAAYADKPVEVDAPTREVWRRVALHFGAALRLVGRSRELDADDVEAVVDDRGAIAHAAGDGADPEARQAIREAVVRVDRARTRAGRADPMAALDLWQALLAGRWTLVEQFDSDGRRFITARKNDPEVNGPRPLTRRQRQVAFYASLGWSLKQIGYALGLADSTINSHLTEALDRLGLRSRAELVRLATNLTAQASIAAGDSQD